MGTRCVFCEVGTEFLNITSTSGFKRLLGADCGVLILVLDLPAKSSLQYQHRVGWACLLSLFCRSRIL
jgi:hypothetical protein